MSLEEKLLDELRKALVPENIEGVLKSLSNDAFELFQSAKNKKLEEEVKPLPVPPVKSNEDEKMVLRKLKSLSKQLGVSMDDLIISDSSELILISHYRNEISSVQMQAVATLRQKIKSSSFQPTPPVVPVNPPRSISPELEIPTPPNSPVIKKKGLFRKK